MWKALENVGVSARGRLRYSVAQRCTIFSVIWDVIYRWSSQKFKYQQHKDHQVGQLTGCSLGLPDWCLDSTWCIRLKMYLNLIHIVKWNPLDRLSNDEDSVDTNMKCFTVRRIWKRRERRGMRLCASFVFASPPSPPSSHFSHLAILKMFSN